MGEHAGYHEPLDKLSPAVMERHRAIVSLQEELEAVDWYDQRVHASNNPDLAEVLAHNRDEEKEHAAMTLEWLRRSDPVLDKHLRTYLFTDGSIVAEETVAEHGAGGGDADTSSAAPDGSLNIGSLKEGRS